MSTSLFATASSPGSSKLPPSPLTVDEGPAQDIETALSKKRSSRHIFKSKSLRRKRKESTASAVSLQVAEDSQRPPNDPLSEHVRDDSSLDTHNDEHDHPTVDLSEPIRVEPPSEPERQNADVYRWAVLYENQRGVTFLNMSRYGKGLLFPGDPPPYTIPISSVPRLSDDGAQKAMRTPCSLSDYQLPDAKWRWISKYWMVDMRGDGQVDASGFEYNWTFRAKGWRPHPGHLSAGGWVRRRRWVRLMMRPADKTLELREFGGDSPSSGLTPSASHATLDVPGRRSSIGTHRTDPNRSYTDLSIGAESALGNTWRGDPQGDWERCRMLMKHFRRDGRKIELWCDWLGVSKDAADSGGSSTPLPTDYMTVKASSQSTVKAGKAPQSTTPPVTSRQNSAPSPLDIEDPLGLSSEDFFTPQLAVSASRENVIPILKEHGQEILTSFIFPDSRAKFLDVLDLAGIGRDLIDLPRASSSASGVTPSPSMPEFWSRRSRITELNEEEPAECRGKPSSEDGRTDGPQKKLSIGDKVDPASHD